MRIIVLIVIVIVIVNYELLIDLQTTPADSGRHHRVGIFIISKNCYLLLYVLLLCLSVFIFFQCPREVRHTTSSVFFTFTLSDLRYIHTTCLLHSGIGMSNMSFCPTVVVAGSASEQKSHFLFFENNQFLFYISTRLLLTIW